MTKWVDMRMRVVLINTGFGRKSRLGLLGPALLLPGPRGRVGMCRPWAHLLDYPYCHAQLVTPIW